MSFSDPSSSTENRPLVGIIADGSAVYGRDVILGATRYINAHRQWEVHGILRRTWDQSLDWPACDGAITAGLGIDALEIVRGKSRHVISCSRSALDLKVHTVCLDSTIVGAMGAEHLIECGLKQFSFYGVPGIRTSDDRAESFTATVKAHELSCIPCPLTFSGLNHLHQTQPWIEMTNWLNELPKPIGIMAFDDSVAYYLAAACRHANLHVPEQIAIVGVNNDELFCEIACTPLSSVEAGFARIGFAAARLLDQLLKGELSGAEQSIIQLPPLGVVRRLSTDILAVDDPQLADAIRYIRHHACDPCSVRNVMRAVAIGRRDLERRFAQKLGRTPGEEIVRIQMETAKRLLLQPEFSLDDVAQRCGYSSASGLVRAFHRVEGITPNAHRAGAQTAGNRPNWR